jgi:hypothetical protein
VAEDNESQDAIVSRLDTLIAAVNRLADAMEGSRTPARPVAEDAEVSAPARHAAAGAVPVKVPQVAAPAKGEGDAAGADTVEVIVDEHIVSGVPGPSAGFKALLARMFEAALQQDTEFAWLELTALTHPRELFAPRALDSLKAFSWKQLRKNATVYLGKGTTDSFSIVRTDPAEPTGDEVRVKVFLGARGRSPAPVTLRRDEAAGGAWRLGQVSL